MGIVKGPQGWRLAVIDADDKVLCETSIGYDQNGAKGAGTFKSDRLYIPFNGMVYGGNLNTFAGKAGADIAQAAHSNFLASLPADKREAAEKALKAAGITQ